MMNNDFTKNSPNQWSPPAQPLPYPVEKKELALAGCVLVFAVMAVNGLFYGGLNLAFGLFVTALMLTLGGFLLRNKKRLNGYSVTLLSFSLLIALGFVRSDDGFVKFVMLLFMLLALNMALTICAGKNPDGGRSLRAVSYAFIVPLTGSFGGLSQSMGGLFGTLRKNGGKGKNVGAVLCGLLVAVPVLLMVVPLLIKADAAFDGMMRMMPDVKISELFFTATFGLVLAVLVFSYSMSLVHDKEQSQPGKSNFSIVHPVSVSTVLVLLAFVYVLYLVSQLAYFFGGMSGILPEGFTLAEYARRGFFEMALLCLVNLMVMVGSIGLVKKEKGIPKLCRWLCAFIGLICLVFVASSAAKMVLYIQGYGLTRRRVLTLVITLFFGICALVVMLWLFVPKLPYMKVILLSALILGTLVLWVDVDTVVASYNVNAYISGRLVKLDVEYLANLSDGAVPVIQRLTQLPQVEHQYVAKQAQNVLDNWNEAYADIRGFNFATWQALKICK